MLDTALTEGKRDKWEGPLYVACGLRPSKARGAGVLSQKPHHDASLEVVSRGGSGWWLCAPS